MEHVGYDPGKVHGTVHTEAFNHLQGTQKGGQLLVPDFALLAYASAIEPLRAANRLSGRDLYRWSHVSLDGGPAVFVAEERVVGHGAHG